MCESPKIMHGFWSLLSYVQSTMFIISCQLEHGAMLKDRTSRWINNTRRKHRCDWKQHVKWPQEGKTVTTCDLSYKIHMNKAVRDLAPFAPFHSVTNCSRCVRENARTRSQRAFPCFSTTHFFRLTLPLMLYCGWCNDNKSRLFVASAAILFVIKITNGVISPKMDCNR